MIHCLLPNHPDHATKRLQQPHLGKGLHLSAQKGFLLQGCLRTAVLDWGSTGTVLWGLQAQAPPNTNCTTRCLLETNWCLYGSATTFSDRFRPCTSHSQPILVLVWTPKEKVEIRLSFRKSSQTWKIQYPGIPSLRSSGKRMAAVLLTWTSKTTRSQNPASIWNDSPLKSHGTAAKSIVGTGSLNGPRHKDPHNDRKKQRPSDLLLLLLLQLLIDNGNHND